MTNVVARGWSGLSDDDRQVLKFVALTGACSTPFWLLGSISRRQILPGLPLSALMTACPLAAAVILTHQRTGRAGVMTLLRRTLDAERIPGLAWYVPTLLLNPITAIAVYEWQRARGVSVPPPEASVRVVSGLALMFLIAAAGEEVGWSGYALDPLIRRQSPLRAGLILGTVWAAWHLIPFLQAGRSPAWIAWQCLKTITTRVLATWLYTRAGKSVFATILFHTSDNLSVFLFPRSGSHYDPRATSIVLTATSVLVFWLSPALR